MTNELRTIEVNGATGHAVLKGFGSFTLIASRLLLDEGIGRPGFDGHVTLVEGDWYPLDGWLRVMQRVADKYGERVLFRIGHSLVEEGPAGAVDLLSALANLDGAYHRNHRRDGHPMWDPVTATPLEGIGHYACDPVERGLAVARSDTLYPCAFDHGLITALSRKFEPRADVVHALGGCRREGAEACTYRVHWGV